MDVVDNGTTSLKKANNHWNISLTSLFDHLYGKTRSRKPRPANVPIIEENQAVIA
jgi:hypothetical protein